MSSFTGRRVTDMHRVHGDLDGLSRRSEMKNLAGSGVGEDLGVSVFGHRARFTEASTGNTARREQRERERAGSRKTGNLTGTGTGDTEPSGNGQQQHDTTTDKQR